MLLGLRISWIVCNPYSASCLLFRQNTVIMINAVDYCLLATVDAHNEQFPAAFLLQNMASLGVDFHFIIGEGEEWEVGEVVRHFGAILLVGQHRFPDLGFIHSCLIIVVRLIN